MNELTIDATGPALRIWTHCEHAVSLNITNGRDGPQPRITLPGRTWTDLPIDLAGTFTITEDLGTTIEAVDAVTDAVDAVTDALTYIDCERIGRRSGMNIARSLLQAMRGDTGYADAALAALIEQIDAEINRDTEDAG